MESRVQAISRAWEALDEGGNERTALDYALPWAAEGDVEACTVCALAYLYLGESDLCDRWTLKAGEHGARINWLSQQTDFEDLAILICRLDTLNTLGTEGLTSLDAQLALQRYLLNGSLEFALFYSIKAIRNLWESSIVEKNIEKLATILVAWIASSEFGENEIQTILGNLTVCSTGALSVKEGKSLLEYIEVSLKH